MTDIISAILAINPEAKVSVNAEDYNQITWLEGTTPIANEDILAKQAELQAEYEAKQYQRDRSEVPQKGGYPSIGDQLDMQYHDLVDGTTTWKDAVEAVKDANPKP
tara:strand:- start:304 stop:621 length:318 start_codon:yes stop_codon:yes gene_type:complete